jgi:glutathione S-transferase
VKLLWAPSSPFCRKVVVFAIEAGLLPQMELVPTATAAQPTALIELNPVGKIPTLVVGESVLYDSRVICEYLDSCTQDSHLFPQGPARWTALRQQALADALVDAAVMVRVELRRAEAERSRVQIDRQTGKMTRAIGRISLECPTFPPDPTIGTISIAVALAYLDFRFAELGWRDDPRLAGWYAIFAARPSMTTSAFRENDP